MTLREWIPQWLQAYKFGTMKQHSYHQLEILAGHFPDDLLDMGGGKTLRGNRPSIDEGGWSKALVELSEYLPISMFVPEEFNA